MFLVLASIDCICFFYLLVPVLILMGDEVRDNNTLPLPMYLRLNPHLLNFTCLKISIPQFECLDTIFFPIPLYIRPSMLPIYLTHFLNTRQSHYNNRSTFE
jgi:hypothetical protein